jgi:hypothetical protein
MLFVGLLGDVCLRPVNPSFRAGVGWNSGPGSEQGSDVSVVMVFCLESHP